MMRTRGGVTVKSPFLRRQLKGFRRNEEGTVLVLVALGMAVLLLMVGMGVDVSYLLYQRNQMQKAADAGAIGGAATRLYSDAGSANITTAAKNDTAANGFTDQASGVTVTVNNPPQSGPFTGNGDYVEVLVAQAQPTFFMKIGGFNSVNVRTRAVASVADSAPACVYVMDPTASASYKASGGAIVNTTCNIEIDSSNSGAFVDTGAACTQAHGIGIVGGIGSDACSTPPTPQTGIAPFSDPLSGLAEPGVGQIPQSCTAKNEHINSGQVVTLPHGTYCGGITIDGGATVTFSSGLYILYGGGLQVNSTSTINGSGVTFYNTGAKGGGVYGFMPITINGVSNSSLSAPTTGTYAGILFFEDRTIAKNGNINNTIDGGSGTTFDGTLYFLTSNLNYIGNSSNNGFTIIIADTLSIAGTSFLGTNYTSLPGGLSPVHGAVLVE